MSNFSNSDTIGSEQKEAHKALHDTVAVQLAKQGISIEEAMAFFANHRPRQANADPAYADIMQAPEGIPVNRGSGPSHFPGRV